MQPVAPESNLTITQKFGYGVGAIAYVLPYQIMASFILFFTTAILHISPIVAGLIVAVSVF